MEPLKKASILWDIENVTPKNDGVFISNLFDFLEEENDLSSATAFGDWSKPQIKHIAGKLADKNFELIHVPKARKNSADISLITHASEMIFIYPHLQRFILITGDVDFRPLLQTLKKHGKSVWIICDAANASEALLSLADKYFDYRSIMTKDYEEEGDNEPNKGISKKAAFALFTEAIERMLEENKTPGSGSVKVKMKLLNEGFDETKLGYKNWKSFTKDAVAKTEVTYDESNNDIFTFPDLKSNSHPHQIPEVFSHLLQTASDTDWTDFSQAAAQLKEKKIKIKNYGYSKFKNLVIDAEKRNLVETQNQGLAWSFRRVKKKK